MIDSAITFRTVIELFTSRAECGKAIGATSGQVSKWWQRDWIPSEWWTSILAIEEVRSAGVTAEVLAELASRSRAVEEAR